MDLQAGLPINIDELVRGPAVEDSRREFKATWNEPVRDAVLRPICAFANDLLNLNGGYVILGIEDSAGKAVLPPRGLDGMNLEQIQQQIRGSCRRLDPEYQPIISFETYQGKIIGIIWAPGGDNRPYQAPGRQAKAYFVRIGSETVEAQGDLLRQLLELTAKIPFDDRRAQQARLEDISPVLVRRFLSGVNSDLARPDATTDERDLYRRMRISSPVNGYDVPKNVALLFFNEDPEQFFPGARIEVVQFSSTDGGDLMAERRIHGPVDHQIREALQYLGSLSDTFVRKTAGKAEAEHAIAYPYEAMEEALVNAIYHRSYEDSREPVKVYLYPNRMEIISYPGPVPGIEAEHLRGAAPVPPVPARNRRVGEFLKELRLAEGRGTGLPKIRRRMRESGSAEATFDFDPSRTYFRVTLPVHPSYQVVHALREASRFWAIGEKETALTTLRSAHESQPGSGVLAAQIVEYAAQIGEIGLAESVFQAFESRERKTDAALPYLRMADVLISNDRSEDARLILLRMPAPSADATMESAIVHKRAGNLQEAHRIFQRAYESNREDPKLLQEFAQTKMRLYRQQQRQQPGAEGSMPLLRQAIELLRAAVAASTDNTRRAWCWFDLAQCLEWSGEPKPDIEAAYQKAIALSPTERFQREFERWKALPSQGA